MTHCTDTWLYGRACTTPCEDSTMSGDFTKAEQKRLLEKRRRRRTSIRPHQRRRVPTPFASARACVRVYACHRTRNAEIKASVHTDGRSRTYSGAYITRSQGSSLLRRDEISDSEIKRLPVVQSSFTGEKGNAGGEGKAAAASQAPMPSSALSVGRHIHQLRRLHADGEARVKENSSESPYILENADVTASPPLLPTRPLLS